MSRNYNFSMNIIKSNNIFNTEEILSKYKLFWQYPAITEKAFYLQNKNNPDYLGLPWATIIDKRYSFQVIFNIIKPYTQPGKTYYTSCQHIVFKYFIPLWKALNIMTVYVAHKQKGIESLDGIILKPCPLYAVNIENTEFNKDFLGVDLLNVERNVLYNFIGGYQMDYMSQIRPDIFKMKHSVNTIIKDTGDWHFNKLVYNPKQTHNLELNLNEEHINKTKYYNELLIKSRYTLAPSGSGPNSIRFWEALGAGSIPVLLADTLELPEHALWNDAIIFMKESEIQLLPEKLATISKERERTMRENCLKIYSDLKDNFKAIKIPIQQISNLSIANNKINMVQNNKIVIHYCCGSYTQSTGGVPRYDYHIYRAFPNRIFFQGPNQKNQMLAFLKQHENNKDNLIVITDNHLSCDIPNEFNIILVHHGVAKTHAVREPAWHPYWKNLCCSGQEKMLYHRKPETTKIISISQFCTDEFTKYYDKVYKKFENTKILHTSELDENLYKTTWNNKPVILGNWTDVNKGSKIVDILKNKLSNYEFKRLSVTMDQTGYEDFNRRKQDIYLQSDIFLQISLCEGNSFATLDALICGIPIVASNVGLFYKDVPEDCFVKLEWERNGDPQYVQEKLEYAWKHREELSKKSRQWFLNNCSFDDWIDKMKKIV